MIHTEYINEESFRAQIAISQLLKCDDIVIASHSEITRKDKTVIKIIGGILRESNILLSLFPINRPI